MTWKFAIISALLFSLAAASADDEIPSAPPTKSVLAGVERKIVNEPKYTSTPRYCLLVLGTNAESKVWMVEDADVLYIDKNGNGDLTDDGPPITQSNIRKWQGHNKTDRGCEYAVDEFQPLGGNRQTNFRLNRWNYGEEPTDSYGLELSLDGKTPMYAGWFGTFWGSSPENAPLVHFGGPLKPVVLRYKEIELGTAPDRLSICFLNPGSCPGAVSRLSIDALPRRIVPEVRIDWPVADAAPPVRTYELLTERCCFWEFYNTHLQIPAGIVPGEATLTVSVPQEVFPFELSTNQVKLPIHAKAQQSPEKAP